MICDRNLWLESKIQEVELTGVIPIFFTKHLMILGDKLGLLR